MLSLADTEAGARELESLPGRGATLVPPRPAPRAGGGRPPSSVIPRTTPSGQACAEAGIRSHSLGRTRILNLLVRLGRRCEIRAFRGPTADRVLSTTGRLYDTMAPSFIRRLPPQSTLRVASVRRERFGLGGHPRNTAYGKRRISVPAAFHEDPLEVLRRKCAVTPYYEEDSTALAEDHRYLEDPIRIRLAPRRASPNHCSSQRTSRAFDGRHRKG